MTLAPHAAPTQNHGDGVKVIALWVDDARKAFDETIKRGAKPYFEPIVTQDGDGEIVRSGIHTYGETVHVFVERKNYKGLFMPGYVKWETEYKPKSTGLKYIDHMVGNVELGAMNKWAKFYGESAGPWFESRSGSQNLQ